MIRPLAGYLTAEGPQPCRFCGVARFRVRSLYMKKLLLLLTIAGLGAGGLYAVKPQWFGVAAAPSVATPAATSTVPAELRDIEYSIQISGDVQPATQLDVKPE